MKLLASTVLLLCLTVTAQAATDTWVGPITVVADKFIKHGGVFGFTYSLDQGDCCCGGPATEDSYPRYFEVDDAGNIVMADHDAGQVLLFASNGSLRTTIIDSEEPKCHRGNSGFIWPGWAGFAGDSVFVSTGYCTVMHDYDGKILWSLGATEHSYPDFAGIWDNRFHFRNFTKEPSYISSEERSQGKTYEDGWLIYDGKGSLVEKTAEKQVRHIEEGDNIVYQGVRYRSVDADPWQQSTLFQDRMKYLYAHVQPDTDLEKNNSADSGAIRIFDKSSAHLYTLHFPESTYMQERRGCAGEGYVAFAGRDVVEEYAKGVYVSAVGDVYATLYLPEMLKVVKWVKADLERPLAQGTLSGISTDGLRRLLNEIYARKGRPFKIEAVRSVFAEQPWYRPAEDYTDVLLNEADRANIVLIVAILESRKGATQAAVVPPAAQAACAPFKPVAP